MMGVYLWISGKNQFKKLIYNCMTMVFILKVDNFVFRLTILKDHICERLE